MELSKEDAELYYRRGLIKTRLGEFENALTDFDKSIEITVVNTTNSEPVRGNGLFAGLQNYQCQVQCGLPTNSYALTADY
ncbi:hypothetical protein [Spirosoma pulveris]